MWIEIWKFIAAAITLGADLVTLVLGVIAAWGLIFHRKKFAVLFKVLVNTFLNERVKRIKETLGKLDSLNFDNKEARPEVFALLGQVSGQIKLLSTTENGLTTIHQELLSLLEKKTKMSEATKRRIVYELHGALDGASFSETWKILDDKA